MRVEVTAEDIAAGKPRSALSCPIAHALTRSAHMQGDRGSVGKRVAVVLRPNGEPRAAYLLPPKAQEFVDKFDKGLKVGPITFEMEVTQW